MRPITAGTFTPPEDLQPAIDLLGPFGRKLLDLFIESNDGKLDHRMIAVAADFERNLPKWQT